MHTNKEQLYKTLTEVLTSSDRFAPKYIEFDSTKFTNFPNANFLVLCSRPFSNINSLNNEIKKAKTKKTVTYELPLSWFCSCLDCSQSVPITQFVVERDAEKMRKIKDTFNGPALISGLLPPVDHLIGRFGHPALQSGKLEAWKQVCGKVESWAVVGHLPELRANPSRKEIREYEQLEKHRRQNAKEFLLRQLSEYEQAKSYPGGKAELYNRCFSLYHVSQDRVVEWLGDYTHQETWSEKSASVTVPLAPYKVENGQSTWV